ncbi:MAG: hypothetical protein ACKO0N_01045 [Planctomycetota bacterium]
MSKNPICHCPPDGPRGRATPQQGELCPRCHGRRLNAEQLLPSPAKRNSQQSALTEFPVLQLDQARQPDSQAKFASPTSEQSPAGEKHSEALRQKSHEAEQRKISRLLALAIVLWALFSLLPGGVAWRSWLGDWSADSFPVWIPLFAAFGAAPFCLGLFLWQVPDWSTLKSVAAGLLASACGYAFAATLYGFSGPSSRWLAWLDFPQTDAAAATLWCSCMLVLAATLSLICFLEGQRWQRVEQLFAELQNNR